MPEIRSLRLILNKINIPENCIKEALSKKYEIDKALLFNLEEIKQRLMNGVPKGEAIKALRLTLLKTHTEFAQELGIDPSTILDWEKERHTPTRGMMAKINNIVLV